METGIDAGIGEVGSWLLVIGAALLLVLLLAATVVVVTLLARSMPMRRVRAMDDRLRGSTPDAGSHDRPAQPEPSDQLVDGASPVPASSGEFCAVVKVLCQTTLSGGHDLRCFFAGDELFDALFADIAAAERTVTCQVFWFKPGRLADRVADALIERARAGVRVLLLLDHWGSKGIGDEYVQRLRDGGVEVAIFRTPHWNTLYKAQNRSHVRVVVIDGRVGYTGGFGIDDRWLGGGRQQGEWRDTSIRIEGPAVDQLQGAFVANWGEATGELLLGNELFSLTGSGDGGRVAGLMYSSPSLGSTSAERFFFASLAGARERCWLTSAYFIPNRHFRRLLCDAASRGVDIRVLTPGANTDRPSTWYAARSHYEELLERGVRLYEYRPTMAHAKTLVADGIWGMVGTLNFDNRSMVLNDEVALLFWDRGLGSELEAAFRADLEWADELTLDAVRARGSWRDHILEWAAGRVDRLL